MLQRHDAALTREFMREKTGKKREEGHGMAGIPGKDHTVMLLLERELRGGGNGGNGERRNGSGVRARGGPYRGGKLGFRDVRNKKIAGLAT